MDKNTSPNNLEKFKDLLLAPLKKGIDQTLATPLGNFSTHEDALRTLVHADTIKMVIKHIENTYNNMMAMEQEYKNKADPRDTKDIKHVPVDNKAA